MTLTSYGLTYVRRGVPDIDVIHTISMDVRLLPTPAVLPTAPRTVPTRPVSRSCSNASSLQRC
jgi:hypothetical protein